MDIESGSLTLMRFVWNDDCPAWPVRTSGLAGPRPRAWVTAPVLLAMVKAVATNTTNGVQFVDHEDAVEQAAFVARSSRATYEGRAVYDVSVLVLNTGSMEPDILDQTAYEAIGEDGVYEDATFGQEEDLS